MSDDRVGNTSLSMLVVYAGLREVGSTVHQGQRSRSDCSCDCYDEAMSTGSIRSSNVPSELAQSELPREIIGDDFRWRDRHLALALQTISLEQLYQMFISRFIAEWWQPRRTYKPHTLISNAVKSLPLR